MISAAQRFALCPGGARPAENKVWRWEAAKAPKKAEKRAEAPLSAAAWKDGGRSFSRRERLMAYTRNVQKGVVFQERGACLTFSG